MPNTLAILPIKSFDAAKQRLQDALEPADRKVLAEAMFTDVLVALRRVGQLHSLLVVTSDNVAGRIAAGYGAMLLEDADEGHNAAAAKGVERALALGAERVLLVPGDCPLMDPAELDGLLSRPSGGYSATIVPDRHGSGTNALLVTPPDALDPAFGPGSRERHEARAREAGLRTQTVSLQSLALDVDTPEDLAAVEAALAATRGGAAHTRGLFAQLARRGG
jgi:2-phospho-L-lactate guanylyltransferase